MSFIGATGLDEVQEQFDILQENIDANASYINNLVGIPDPTHTAIFGINILNPGLFGLVERAEVNIAALQTGEEGLGTDLSALTTQVEGIQGEITGIQGEITALEGQISAVEGSISFIQFTELPAIGTAIAAAAGVAGDALGKANKSLGIWDEDGNNTYNMKSGNVAIGILPKGTLLNNKLEVNGSINIPTNSKYKINNVPLSYSDLAGTPPVSSKWTNATDVVNNIYYNTGNVGIGITTAINNKLEVGGNLNISAGSKYKINNVNLAFSDLGGTLSYNSLTDKLTGGTNISIVGNAINNTLTAGTNISIVSGAINNTLTAGTNISIVSGAINNTLTAGTNISIVSGAINNTYTYTLPTAGVGSGGILGGVKVDNSTITITNGVISAVSTASGASISLDGSTNNRSYGWTGSTSLLGRVGVAETYSTGSILEDVVLRSQGKLILQSGTTNPAMVIDTTNNAFFRNAVGIGTSTIAANNILDIGGVFRVGNNVPLYSFLVSNITGNVGMGTTAQTNSKLHLHKSGASLVKIHFTDGFTGTAETNGLTIYKSSTDEGYFWNYQNKPLIFGTNNLERLRILEGGNVGIGTTSPSSRLHIHTTLNNQNLSLQFTDTSTLSGGLLLNKSTNNNGYLLNYENASLLFGTNSLERMRISAGGNVGIGTNNPNDFLHLHKNTANTDVSFTLTDLTTGSAFGNGFRIRKMTTEDVEIVNGHNKDLIFGANNTNYMRIKEYGAVGIQTEGYAIVNNYMWGGSLTIGNVSNNYGGGTTSWNTSTAGLLMECLDSTEIAVHDAGHSIHSFMRYTTNGNFTIGRNMGHGVANVSLAGALSVANYVLSSARVYSRGGGYDTWLYSESTGMSLNMGNQSTESAATYFRMGAYNGHTFLESNQQRSFIFKIYTGTFTGTAPTWRFESSYNCFNANNSTSWNQVSDQRIKENIVKADLKTCYDNIKNINLYRYKFIDAFDNGFRDKNKLGYIAQEVKKYFPKATYRDKNRLNDNREIPDLLSIDVEQINASLYGAVKQLIKVVEKQSKRIKALETLLNIENNDDVEDDAGQPYERIYDEDEIDIDTIQPTEPSKEV